MTKRGITNLKEKGRSTNWGFRKVSILAATALILPLEVAIIIPGGGIYSQVATNGGKNEHTFQNILCAGGSFVGNKLVGIHTNKRSGSGMCGMACRP
jgi:hypothetical protein